MSKLTIPKKIIGTISPDEVKGREYKIAKHSREVNPKASETDEIKIILSNVADIIIEVLSTEGLKTEFEPGRPIIWINNFAIKRKSTNEYMDREYTVHLPPNPKGYGTFVYQVGNELYADKKPQPINPGDPNSPLAVTLVSGDPATGWAKP